MTSKIITLLIVVVGIINFIPIIGVLSSDLLTKLYGINIQDNNMLILMKHRALLFGITGGFIIYAAFQPTLHKMAFIIGFISMLGFVAIALQTGQYNSLLSRIVIVDIVASAFLFIAVILSFLNKTN